MQYLVTMEFVELRLRQTFAKRAANDCALMK
jgi:hypothetical protein